jgi:hypothetical protein
VSIRNRVLAVAAAVGVAVALLPAAPAAAALAPCTATVTMTRWGGPWAPNTGIVANFDVTNNTIPGITNFQITFVSAKVISVPARWGFRSSGSRTLWSVRPHSGNPNLEPPLPPEDPALPPGRTIEFGFQGELAGQITTVPPSSIVMRVSVGSTACEVFYSEV